MKLIYAVGMVFLSFLSSNLFASTYWVNKTGSDTKGCSDSQTNACLTIQKGLSLVKPGDTLYVGEGTYIEDSSKSSYTTKCGWFDPIVASLCMRTSGTAAQPIILSAAPGAEGKVILDSQSTRMGIQFNGKDYIAVKGFVFINNMIIGVGNYGQVQNVVPNMDELSVGTLIENNKFYNTWGPQGENVSAIGMWGSKDWIVRSNVIDGVSAGAPTIAAGIQSYGVINALIEKNTITNVGFGVFWKDHFVQDLTARTPWDESEIRENIIKATNIGVQIGIRGDQSVEAGNNYVHHNIIYGLGADGIGIYSNMAGAFGVSADLDIRNNLIDGGGSSGTVAVSIDSQRTAHLYGNIMVRVDLGVQLIKYSDVKVVNLVSSDYNIYDNTFQNAADRYSATGVYFHTLADWKKAQDSQFVTLAMSSPDSHSITSSASVLFNNPSAAVYTHKSGSPAIGFLPDKTNAGPYQNGNEVIGGPVANPPGAPIAPKIK